MNSSKFVWNPLPQSHVNTGTVIRLRCTCPPSCKCGAKTPHNWVHKKCSMGIYINDQGDLFCCNVPKSCKEYFIKDASFQCNNSNSWEKFASFSQFAMALAQAIQAAEFGLSEQDQVRFVGNLSAKAIARWNM